MKFLNFFCFFILIYEILSPIPKDNIQPKIVNKDGNIQHKNNPDQNNNINIQNNNQTNITQNNTKKEGISKETKEKLFNLTESLINFFVDTFGSKDNKTENKDNKQEKEDEGKTKKVNDERIKKLQEERDKKRKEEQEKFAKLEKIKIENAKKEEKQKEFQKERLNFIILLTNNSFSENIQLYLQKGEKEILYLNLERFQKMHLAIMVSDEDQNEKINFFFSGPNHRGYTTVIHELYHKNYLSWEYEAPVSGEYYIEITNKGTKDNEIYCLLNENINKKKDILDKDKVDKISLLLNDIDSNINQLRNKKKIEIKQINSHNDKVTNNNLWITIYSIIEIFTMIIIFFIQSCYINSLVTKL